jgi:hypothetical protein
MNDERFFVYVVYVLCMCVSGVVPDRSCDLDSTLYVVYMYRVSGKCPALSDALDPGDWYMCKRDQKSCTVCVYSQVVIRDMLRVTSCTARTEDRH